MIDHTIEADIRQEAIDNAQFSILSELVEILVHKGIVTRADFCNIEPHNLAAKLSQDNSLPYPREEVAWINKTVADVTDEFLRITFDEQE